MVGVLVVGTDVEGASPLVELGVDVSFWVVVLAVAVVGPASETVVSAVVERESVVVGAPTGSVVDSEAAVVLFAPGPALEQPAMSSKATHPMANKTDRDLGLVFLSDILICTTHHHLNLFADIENVLIRREDKKSTNPMPVVGVTPGVTSEWN